MAIIDVEIIVGSVNISGDDGGEVAAVLLLVATAEDVNHTLGVGIT